MKLDFIIAGVMKSGTTYLDNLIRRHPEVCMPKRSMKYSFFDNDNIYQNGIEWYKSIFNDCEKTKKIGQTSADIAFNPGAVERLKLHFPDTKIIFVIRHPIDRSYSLYWHQVRMAREILSFEEAIENEDRRMQKDYYHFKMYSYISRSRYAKQFANIFDHFNRDQVCIIPLELLLKNEQFFMNHVFKFLGVKEMPLHSILNLEEVPRNSAKLPSSMWIVKISYFLQKIGLTGPGQRVLNLSLEEKRPPKINPLTRENLEILLEDDIRFFNGVVTDWKQKLKT